jgi:hypothetical protein
MSYRNKSDRVATLLAVAVVLLPALTLSPLLVDIFDTFYTPALCTVKIPLTIVNQPRVIGR